MIVVNGIELDFDITSPPDMLRYKEAGERMTAEAENVPVCDPDPDKPGFIDGYIDMLNAELRLYGDFLDAVFGDGVAEKLLTKTPSLNKLFDVEEAIGAAFEGQGEAFGKRMSDRFDKYKPNRASRRAK